MPTKGLKYLPLLLLAACAAPGVDVPVTSTRTLVVVDKTARELSLYQGSDLAGAWPVALGRGGPVGPKRAEGDLRTPEGWYSSSDKPTSDYHGAIAIHYPNIEDADLALADGRIDAATRDQIATAIAAGERPPQQTPLGGEILIHGGGAGTDWTLGCIALADEDIDALRARLPDGMRTDVLITR